MMYNYKVVLTTIETEDGMEWSASFPDFDNVVGSGKTQEEALNDAYANLKYELEVLKDEGVPIPSPINYNYSGKLMLRLPKSLHRKLSELSDVEGTSINQMVVSIISESIGFYQGAKKNAAYSFAQGCKLAITKTLDNERKGSSQYKNIMTELQKILDERKIAPNEMESLNHGYLNLIQPSKSNSAKPYVGDNDIIIWRE